MAHSSHRQNTSVKSLLRSKIVPKYKPIAKLEATLAQLCYSQDTETVFIQPCLILWRGAYKEMMKIPELISLNYSLDRAVCNDCSYSFSSVSVFHLYFTPWILPVGFVLGMQKFQ